LVKLTRIFSSEKTVKRLGDLCIFNKTAQRGEMSPNLVALILANTYGLGGDKKQTDLFCALELKIEIPISP
jgi:hypothetical protein